MGQSRKLKKFWMKTIRKKRNLKIGNSKRNPLYRSSLFKANSDNS